MPVKRYVEDSYFGFAALLNNAYLMCIHNHVSGEMGSAKNRCRQTGVKCSSFTCGNSLGWRGVASTACVNNTAAWKSQFSLSGCGSPTYIPICLCVSYVPGVEFSSFITFLTLSSGPDTLKFHA